MLSEQIFNNILEDINNKKHFLTLEQKNVIRFAIEYTLEEFKKELVF